ncbi:hypothetical protein A2482_01915 [Candidatus Falkowbacteria bacterium RIFOXYC2_FULL_48_21]|uniref:Uncharacterized protein n=1 Tax=Candidatus Falkowbacteria bacterium RIFOXYC2_FULL_48_21 TaxID=1798005 RepID=A0A1F5T8K5_9BACT|nr:MAG: hypothetical protein A2482_01915 [Candidatus Falkowbacteria bacterium RIFOXYC2_FULL_48_21]
MIDQTTGASMDNETFSHRLDEHWRRDMDELTREMSREPAGFCDCLVGVGMLGLYLIFLPIIWLNEKIGKEK